MTPEELARCADDYQDAIAFVLAIHNHDGETVRAMLQAGRVFMMAAVLAHCLLDVIELHGDDPVATLEGLQRAVATSPACPRDASQVGYAG